MFLTKNRYRYNPLQFHTNDIVEKVRNWTIEAFGHVNRFIHRLDDYWDEEDEEEVVYDPVPGGAVPLDPPEEVHSDGEENPKECVICVDEMKHPRTPFDCTHSLCHNCARVQLCPFCRSAKRARVK